jgi:meso-butanediol dehydrogenase / (S,S)-butanediol dehydrogenase / diacetyl reductase
MKLQGKVALVTGAGRGIGKGIAMALAKEGVDISAADIIVNNAEDVAEEVKGLGRRSMAAKVDVTKWEEVKGWVDDSFEKLGRIDIMVNNAGVICISPVETLEEKDFDWVMDVNVKGTFLGCKAVIPYMKKQGGGKIINVASIAGKEGFATLAHYTASKFAVVGFTNALAKELAGDNINVNAICPGIVRTYMWDLLSDVWKQPGETVEDSWARHQKSIIPQGRAQTPEDMGELALYFALAENVTGQSINVDGGVTFH